MRSFLCTLLLAGGVASIGRADEKPIIQMLVPGFTVQELPVKLSNLNNLQFAPDGRLFALAYDGRIHVLIDTNGDGLEDHDELFWDKTTLSVPVGMALSPEGVYVSSHGKVSLLRDTKRTGHADLEEIVATGWPPTDVASGGVDATAVTFDKSGNLYFGLIAADYSNPYRVKDGVSHYDPLGKRGTIQKLSRNHKTLETVATGIRVPYSLAFNKAGDLFCTDQEGETWCPNGNPLDELNQILPGRNYGFPPRHEKWLPNLESEPPVVAFGPQHQSTCGMVFNEPKKGQRLVGPTWWRGDAFIAGESRGKIWRVRLVKTAHGYIGKEFLIARLSMLTTDLAISPRGELYVCCHSGQPDWGTGPKGEGRIFKITYTDPDAPQPVLAWRSALTEVRVSFDKPIDPGATNAVRGGQIEFGEYVRAADRLEQLKPPYQVVKQQDISPRGRLNIVSVTLADSQTLVLKTDPHPQPVTYAITLPGIKSPKSKGPRVTVDLDYDLGTEITKNEIIELSKSLPHGKQIVASVRQSGGWNNSHRASYPFIHPPEVEVKSLELAGGDYESGRSLFFGEQQKCSTCHRIRGEGGTIGPDLSNLISMDAASVLRDIKEPSSSIHPDYVAYLVELKNGEALTGFVRAQDERTLKLISADGKEVTFAQNDVASIHPSAVSLMPKGLIDSLDQAKTRDLLLFLMSAPPNRTAQDLESISRSAPWARASDKPLKLVLIASKQDHGRDQHDYPAWQRKWHALLAHESGITVEDAWLWPSPDQFEKADVLVFYYWNREWNADKFTQLDKFLERGGGLVALHSATIGNPDPQQLAVRLGLASDSGKTKYRHTPVSLMLVAPTNNPIVQGLPRQIHFLDEPYWPMVGDTNKIDVLATAELDGAIQPIMWTFEKGKGRVFVSIFGHYTWTLDDPLFRTLVLRGIGWAAGGDVNRLSHPAGG
jgi:putative heme-binding domain-containing protein